jgi:galactitol-specific phosphotransferase system IIB component
MADDSKKQVENLLKSNKLSKENLDYFKKIAAALDDTKSSTSQWNQLLKSITDTLDKTSDNLSYIAQSFKDSVQDLQKANVAVNQQRSSLNKLSNIARDLRDIRQGDKEFTDKTLNTLKERAKTEISNLQIAKAQLISQGKSVEAIKDQIKTAGLLLEEYKEIEKVNNEINKDLSITSSILGGLDKVLQKAGFGKLGVQDALMKTRMLGQQARALGEDFNANATFTKELGKNLSGALSVTKLIEISIGFIVKKFIELDKLTGDTAKNLGISYEQSRNLNKEFTQLATTSDNIFVTTKNLNESFGQLSDRFSVNEGFSNELLTTQLELTKQAGYQAETANELAKLSLLTGKSTKEIAANALGTAVQFNAQNKLALNEKKILEDVAKTSSAIQLSFGNSTDALVTAVATARKFGLELSQVENIASGLLNFEESISNELQAELLINKDLSLEKARQAALNNDLATVAEEIATQVGSAAEFTSMNRIQQEALAKSVGLTRDDLAKSLQEREALAKLGTDATTAQEAYNKLLAQGLSQDEIAKKLGDDKLADQLKANNIQERFNQSLQKAQEIFVEIASAVSPLMSSLADGVSFVAQMINKFSTLIKIIAGIYALNKSIAAINAVSEAIEQRRVLAKQLQMGLGGQILTMLGLENAALEYATVKQQQGNTFRAIGAALEKTKLGLLVAQGAAMVKNLAKGALELAQRIAVASANLVANAASTFGIGTIVALAAAAGGIAYLKSATKADDLMSTGTGASGYGDRVLLAGKDTFALNNSDTVIAGTNLGGGRNVTGEQTNRLLSTLIRQNAKKPELSPVNMYEIS